MEHDRLVAARGVLAYDQDAGNGVGW